MIQVFQAGETIAIWAYIKDWEGVYRSPDNGVKLTLVNPSGVTKVDAQAMTPDDTGKFVYYYNSQSDDVKGWWRYSCKGQDGAGGSAKYTISTGSFELK